jgi:hypothetical protein
MASQNSHIIQRQVIEVEMENPPDAFAFRNRLGELYYQQILPKLESVFDEVGGAGKLIREEYLNIDLGAIPSENWEEMFVEATVKRVKEELLLAKTISIEDVSGVRTKWIREGQVGELALIKKHDVVEEVLDFFLKHGFLPWHAQRDFDIEKELTAWLEISPEAARQYFQRIVAENNGQVLHRLIYRFEEKTLNSILNLIFENVASELFKEIIRYKKLFKTYLSSFLISSSDIKKIVYLPLFDIGENSGVKYLSRFFYQIQKQVPSVSLVLIKNNLKAAFREYVRNQDLSLIFSAMDSVLPANDSDQEIKETQKQDTYETEGIYIRNAGLVILQPFLPVLFSSTGITDANNQFINEEMHGKAVLFTQFLVSGATEINEEELSLNKVLCGYPLQKPLATELELSDAEIAEANDFLRQVTGLWTMKGIPVNNSVTGLRESFLQREGKLMSRDKDWLLRVEQKSFDMVLSSLPWTISIIKTNWMEGMLCVEWT